MPFFVRTATAAEVSLVLSWSHSYWGGKRDLAQYEAFTRGILATPWAQRHYVFKLAFDAAGTPVAACKRYVFDVQVEGQAVTALGFGAVFTHVDHRKQGHAAAMLQQLMAEAAAEGIRYAVLYSDIEPAYYAKLGFSLLGGQEAEAVALPGPGPFLALAPGDEAQAAPWWDAVAPAFRPFHYTRSADYVAYLAQRNGQTTWLYQPDGVSRGYVVGSKRAGEFGVSDAAWEPGVDETAFWLDVRRLAGGLAGEAAVVTGWLPPGAAAAGFALSAIDDGIPMVAALGDAQLPPTVPLWGLDHF